MPALDAMSVGSLEDEGFLLAMTTTNAPRLLPLATVRAGFAPADTAVQPADLGSMAYQTGAALVSSATGLADFAAISGRLAALEGLD
jgi:hypothetical protein